jgi:hypothetical protein
MVEIGSGRIVVYVAPVEMHPPPMNKPFAARSHR